jgi:hypothetical protein
LFIAAGDQVPATPFGEAFDKVGTESPAQIVSEVAKSGTIVGSTVTFNVVEVAHWPAFGVKT